MNPVNTGVSNRDFPGWFPAANREQLERLIDEYQIHSVIEIGSFLGASALWFAERVDQVQCVDTWFEDAKEESDNNVLRTLRIWEMPRDFFSYFRDNAMRSGLWHKVIPIRGRSREVHPYVIPADLVYIDGDHSHEGCYRDIEIYHVKAAKIVCGDDYVKFNGFGVIEAVTEWFPNHRHAGRFWWAAK